MSDLADDSAIAQEQLQLAAMHAQAKRVAADNAEWRKAVSDCQDCGEQISEERKAANVFAIRCTECASQQESRR